MNAGTTAEEFCSVCWWVCWDICTFYPVMVFQVDLDAYFNLSFIIP